MWDNAHFSWDYFPRRLSAEEIMDPHEGIREFFFQYDFEDAKKAMEDWLQSVFEEECTLDQDFVNLYDFYENVEKLLEIAYLLRQSVCGNEQRESPGLLGVDLHHPAALIEDRHYRYAYFEENLFFDRFPRSLDREEFINPYLVFVDFFEFCTLPQWRNLLKLWFEAAVSQYSIIGNCEEDVNLYLTARYLKKLVEACFFLCVRKLEKEKPAETPLPGIADPEMQKSGGQNKGDDDAVEEE